MFGAIELRQRRAALIDDAGAILTTASTEGRALTPEDRERFDRMHADADAMGEDITRIERQEQQARDLATTANARQDVRRDLNLGPAGPSNDEAVNAALVGAARRQWMRFGLAGMSAEQRAVANFADSATMQAAIEALPPEQRIAQTVTTGGGGYLIEQEWMQEIDVAMLKYGNMREACRVITTATGALIPYPTLNDTGNAGRLLAINQPITNVALAYGVVNMQAYKYSSDSILVPSELAQDSAFDIDGHVRDQLAIRLGRITNTHFATGTGSGQPQGITVGAADSGVDLDISGGQTYANWVAFEHSIDPDYRLGAGFIMHDTVLENAKAVLDGNSRPIFRGMADAPGGISAIMGYPLTVNNGMPSANTNLNKCVVFGDLQKYIIRQVRPMVLLRLVERYADNDQIGFIAFERVDGNLIDAGTNPIKYAEAIT